MKEMKACVCVGGSEGEEGYGMGCCRPCATEAPAASFVVGLRNPKTGVNANQPA